MNERIVENPNQVILNFGEKMKNINEQFNTITKLPTDFKFNLNGDDTDKIQLALQSSNTFKFPTGEYNIIEKIVRINKSINIVGDGVNSVVKIKSNQLADGTRIVFENVDGITIKNIKFTEINEVLGRHNLYGTIAFVNCKNILLENVIIDGSNGCGIHGIKCENVTIKNCIVTNTKADGIHFQRGSKNVRYIDNIVVNNADDCLAFVSHDYENYGNCDGLEACGNILGSNITTGSGICADGSKNIKIHDNKISNTILAGVRVNPIKESGQTQIAYPSNVEVYDNTISDCGSGTSGNRSYVSVSQANNVKVINNKGENGLNGGYYVTGCEGLIEVSGNVGQLTSNRFIWISSQQTKNTFANIIVRNNNSKINGIDGIYIDCTNLKSNLTVVENNTFDEINQSNSSSIYGIFAKNVSNIVVSNNVLYTNNTILKIALTSCDNIIRTNNIPYDNNEQNYIGSSKYVKGGSIPTSGTWNLGDIVWNWNPSTTGSPVGWICIASGSPGTWRTFATVQSS